MKLMKRLTKAGKRGIAGVLAVVMAISGIGVPMPSLGSEIWPQKSTAPFYCLDGGKGWKSTDRYEIYKYDTMPSALTETQAKRLFWAYPSNWNALKEAAAKYDSELYNAIKNTVSGPNVVKRVKDDPGTTFAWVADNPEIETRAIAVLERSAAEQAESGKEAPEAIKEATSEEKAVSFTVLPFSAGPGALDTEFSLGTEFIKDIAGIEAQSVWDNGSDGGNVGWLDASQDKNIAKSVLGDSLYEITWSGDSIKIRNNGSVTANENAVGSTMTEEQKYNKTTVRYKITMRKDSGWYTEGSWNEDYLREWMDFKACVNAPGQQRLYKADIRVVPSDMVFYLVISQDGSDETFPAPEYGGASSEYDFHVYRHEEQFESNYNVKMKKIDDETGMPLKGSQFYLYERFEDADVLCEEEENGGLLAERLNFVPWDGFQVFAEGTTDQNGEIRHTDTRSYVYSKTYCDGHGMPEWVSVPEESDSEEDEDSDTEDSDAENSGAEEARDRNRAIAGQWIDLFEACEKAGDEGGNHFHWVLDASIYNAVQDVLDSGEPSDSDKATGADVSTAFEKSGCREDCEETYEAFINLKFSYTWKEIQARNGYILHDVHEDDIPIEVITTVSSEAGAKSSITEGSSRDIGENIWYSGNNVESRRMLLEKQTEYTEETTGLQAWNFGTLSGTNALYGNDENVWYLKVMSLRQETDNGKARTETDFNEECATGSNATESNASEKGTVEPKVFSVFRKVMEYLDDEGDDSEWETSESMEDFSSYLNQAKADGIEHLPKNTSGKYSYANRSGAGRDHWIIRDHRTEGQIHINKRDLDLYRGEDDEYSAFGDTEGDGVLEGAVYGLFAAEDILHPDSDLADDGSMTNTGIVYRKNDLVSVAETDTDGNAGFLTYTIAPGMTFDYETKEITERKDEVWRGPENLYGENLKQYGNWWIGRPLILGSYYVKELSRSEGYELSINGKSKEWTNYGTTTETPDAITESNGMAVVSVPELSASMEGEDESGNGYDQFSFIVTSSGTTNTENGREGYEMIVSGFPENTKFYRVDSGEKEVTGPHVAGTEETVLRDAEGNIIWKTADSDTSHVRYEPEYNESGELTGQTVMCRVEPQILTAEQVPQAVGMILKNTETELEDDVLYSPYTEDVFGVLKAELERILNRNGYEIPITWNGICSQPDAPVYSMGVKKGDEDSYGMTTDAGEPAVKTVYGSATRTILIENSDPDTTVYELLGSLLSWYQENSQWSFGGLHSVEWTDDGYEVTLYAGASASGSRRFFTMKQENGKLTADKVYAVVENPLTLRWEYQEYDNEGVFQYQILKQYCFGRGTDKRYYIDVVLMPAVMVNGDGELEIIEHTVMAYHKRGEEIIDYLIGDPENGYKVPETEITDKIEITTEMEYTEEDVRLQTVSYDSKNGIYRIQVKSSGTDVFGKDFSDEEQSLTLSFMAVLPEKKAVITDQDIKNIGSGNVYGYKSGDIIGYAEYLMQFKGASVSVATGTGEALADTYIVAKKLVYRGQHRVTEDGDTSKIPVQVLQRPVKQKIKVVKNTEDEQAMENFRFKIYLKSNLERLYREEDGTIAWLDKYGNPVDIREYKNRFPELVQKIYTRETNRKVVEAENYEKFFDAIRTANTDLWKNEGRVWNTSWKPFAENLFTRVKNKVNASDEAVENAKRSDAVRQFAIDWYLEDEIQKEVKSLSDLDGYLANDEAVTYQDEIYDKALYQAILQAEEYLAPFFNYDLDFIYAVLWDSEKDGGIDGDWSTLSADQIEEVEENLEYAFGVSEYLPYGTYMVVEQQPYKAEWRDLKNRHFTIDTPKEIALPLYSEDGTIIPHQEVEWSVTEPGTKADFSGYGCQEIYNDLYKTRLRIEKIDGETGEPILHEDAVFALYRAERNEEENSDGAVKRYEIDSVIAGSREFLEAMGAQNITPFARSVGNKYFGLVEAGTPVCREEDVVLFNDKDGRVKGQIIGLSTVKDSDDADIFQTTGYVETSEPVPAGVYVLAELKAPAGYVRSKPVPIEIYSDAVMYYPDGGSEKAAAVKFDVIGTDTARIYVNDEATNLEVSKMKTEDRYRGMKVSGRVEGTISGLSMIYGLENLELAYNSMGTYLGFGWKKGTLEMLESRKTQGERVEIVYENGVFQGYGYVTRKLETADDENRYAAGAILALYDAIEVRKNGDSEDYAFEGVNVSRDRNGNVTGITVEEGYAGEKTEMVLSEEGIWKAENIKRKETPVLFYDLGNLKVLDKSENEVLYGYDKSGQKMKITSDTDSVFAIRGGRAVFEIVSEDFSEITYDKKVRAFTGLGENTVIYHLDENLCRDAQVDGYTGLAYVEKTGKNPLGQSETHFFVWPITEFKDSEGNIISREKILTGRPGERNEGTEQAYITGTWNEGRDTFEKVMNPVYDKFGMVQYYLPNDSVYQKGKEAYDRDGDYLGYRYNDLLESYNRAAYRMLDHDELYGRDEKDLLQRRQGEAWVIPNIWVSGMETPQDPGNLEMTYGKADLLRRVIPGTYIMEEISPPQGYVKGFPTAVRVEETGEIQRVSMTDEKIKVEILKVDGTDQYKKQVNTEEETETGWYTEGKGAYTGKMIKGARLALYKAKRVYVSDYEQFPKGYYLVKEESTPATWTIENPVDNSPVVVEAMWITDGMPRYFEGIPAGDYILEELESPSGYLADAMELTVKDTKELQSFIMLDDHTKLEIFKYEKDDSGKKKLLSKNNEAELTLYPAVVDTNGEVVVRGGELQYEKENPIDTWTTVDFSAESEKIMAAYEVMFKEYGDSFEQFSWESPDEGVTRKNPVILEESHSTGNGETVTQIWKLEDDTRIRITAVRNDGQARLDSDGTPEIVFEYQFQYKESHNLVAPNMVSYDTENGLHRLDRVPVGTYVLVETKTPEGYETAKPKVINVGITDSVQRFEVENRKELDETASGLLLIEKVDKNNPDKKLSGAWFEVKNLHTGECWRNGTDETGTVKFVDLPIDGPDRAGNWKQYVYQIREVTAPAGYWSETLAKYVRFDDNSGEMVIKYTTMFENQETKVCIRKTDITTGEELPGAKLTLRRKDGGVVDQWISEYEPHVITGTLIAGETYILTEESAPEGYLVAEDVEFTVSMDGTVTQVVMEDERKNEPEKPEDEQPGEPEETVPEEPSPDKDKPEPSEEPESEEVPKEPEHIKKYGRITAKYKIPFIENGVVYLDETGKSVQVEAPVTGDEWPIEIIGSCLIISFIGIVLILLTWSDKEEKGRKGNR